MIGTPEEIAKAIQIENNINARIQRVVEVIAQDETIDRTFVTPELIAQIQSAMPALMAFYAEKPAALLIKRENNLVSEIANLWGDDHKNAHISNAFFALQTVVGMLNNNSIRKNGETFTF